MVETEFQVWIKERINTLDLNASTKPISYVAYNLVRSQNTKSDESVLDQKDTRVIEIGTISPNQDSVTYREEAGENLGEVEYTLIR